MTDTDPTQSAPIEAPDQGASVVNEPAPQAQPSPGEEAWYEDLRRQYPNASDDRALAQEAWKSYRHAQNALQSRQPEPAPEPEPEPYNPYAALSFGTDPDLYQQWQASLQHNPHQAINTVLQSPEAYGQQIVSEAFLLRLQQDPMSAIQQAIQPVLEQRFGEFQQQQQQGVQPWVETTATALGDAAEALAAQMAPDYQAYRQPILDYLAQNPHHLDPHKTPQALAGALVDLRDWFWARDQRRQAQQPTQNGASASNAAPRTQTRSSTTRPDQGDAQARLLHIMRTGEGLS